MRTLSTGFVDEWDALRDAFKLPICLTDILLLIWLGHTQQETAVRVQVPVGTVKSRRKRVYDALGVFSAVEAALEAERAIVAARAEC